MQSEQIAIYVHWPFCESKCPYCDFNSHVRLNIDDSLFLECYLKEISSYKDYLAGKKIKSIFFGGGTPSLAPAKIFESIINSLSSYFEPNIEITIEANPGSSEISKFRDFKKTGINRISIGVQSFDDNALKFLGRKHSSYAARRAIEMADQVFSNYSFDLIYALPWHTLDLWQEELEKSISYAKHHLSLYQLTIEKGTPFFIDYSSKKFSIPNEELAADLYLLTNKITAKHGFESYEVSNYAKEGKESIHNLTYWNYQDYIGIGPGAHGRITKDDKKIATMNFHAPEKWCTLIRDQGSSYQTYNEVSLSNQMRESLLMGLRLSSGLDLKKISVDQSFIDKLSHLQSDGLIVKYGDIIKVTDSGRLLLNSVLQYLL